MTSRIPRITRTGRRLADSDPFFRAAKADGYVARSAFKLLEIQTKHKLIPPGGRVCDLGCHPGAWLQVACQALGPRSRGGLVLGIDIQPTEVPPKFCDDRVKILQADARTLTPDFWMNHFPDGFDVVLSDMCHFTHGNSVADSFKSLELARTAFEMAILTRDSEDEAGKPFATLRPGGALVMKLLQGQGTQEFAQEIKQYFGKVAWHRPKATRKESKEVFLIGLNRK